MGWDAANGILTNSYTTDDLRLALGLSTATEEVDASGYFNGTLGTINRWSEKKPVKSNLYVSVDMADLNFGFNTEYIAQAGINNIFNTAKTNKTWLDSWYIKPKGYNTTYPEWYRWEDFNGYNKNSVEPFNYRWIPGTELAKGPYELRIDRQFPSFDPIKMYVCRNWKYAIMYRTGGGEAKIAYLNTEKSNEITNATALIFVCDFSESGTWECLLCCVPTDYTEGSTVVWMPNGYFTVTIAAEGSGSTIVSKFSAKLDTTSINPSFSSNTLLSLTGSVIKIASVNRIEGNVEKSSAYLTFTFLCYNSSGDNVATFDVTESNSLIEYPNKGTVDFNAGAAINMLRYVDEGTWEKVSYVEIRPSITSAENNVQWNLEYNTIPVWTAYKPSDQK